MAPEEEKLTLQSSLYGEMEKLVVNMSTGTESMAKSPAKRFRLLSSSPQSLLSKRLNEADFSRRLGEVNSFILSLSLTSFTYI